MGEEKRGKQGKQGRGKKGRKGEKKGCSIALQEDTIEQTP